MIKQFLKKISILTMNPTLDSGEPSPTFQYNRAVLGQGSFYSIICDKERREPWHLKCPFLERDEWILNLTWSHTQNMPY